MSSDNEKPDYFKTAVIVMLTVVSLFTALVSFLQNYAGLRASDLAQQSSFKAVNSTGLYFRAGLEAAQGTDVLQRYEDYVQRAVRADTKARALRMGAQTELAAEYDLDADRWRSAADEVAQTDPLLDEFGQDQALYNETLSREAYFEEEREHTFLDQARDWSSKANSYVAVLSTLSVALFLAGLSLTLGSWLRFFLAAASLGLTLLCSVWVLVVLVTPVARISEEAIGHFVDGRIAYTLATDRGEDAVDAIPEFDEAIRLAPQYARAYFYRSLANTDSSLLDKRLDTQQGIDDGLRAVELGNASSPVYGNLGWLYYINGQYNAALANTRTALEMSPDDCYLPFNHGLILMALQRPDEANSAYDQAIDCAQRQSSDYYFNYYLDVGVIDLHELAVARPDLADGLDPAMVRLKEAQASLTMYGEIRQPEISVDFGPMQFGTSVDEDDNLQDTASEFPQSATIVYAQWEYENMDPDSRWMTRWLLDGREYLTTVYDNWAYGESGSVWVNVYNTAGLNSGTYELDVFVDGKLMNRGEVVVLPGNLPPMYYYYSSGVGLTIAYPLDWNVTDLADNEVSVVAARDPDSLTFFGVTAWVAGTGTDQDIFDLFGLYFDALEQTSSESTLDEREAFTVAGLDGWLNYFTYTNADGDPIQGALAGVLDANQEFAYIVVIESHADDWDPLLDVFNAMLKRMALDD